MHMVIVFSKMTYNAQTRKVKTFYPMFLIEYKGTLSNPCLLFYRDEEVDDLVIDIYTLLVIISKVIYRKYNKLF